MQPSSSISLYTGFMFAVIRRLALLFTNKIIHYIKQKSKQTSLIVLASPLFFTNGSEDSNFIPFLFLKIKFLNIVFHTGMSIKCTYAVRNNLLYGLDSTPIAVFVGGLTDLQEFKAEKLACQRKFIHKIALVAGGSRKLQS